MPKALLTWMTVSALLWHALFGCCGHHDHADDGCATHAEDSRELASCGYDCEQPGHSHQFEHRHLPCHKQPCSHGVCQYITAPSGGNFKDNLSQPALTQWAANRPPTLVALTVCPRQEPWQLQFPPPVSLHLVFQSLLI